LNKSLLNVNFSAYGQAARQLRVQLYGYLIADQERDNFTIKLESVDNETLGLLSGVHAEIVRINTRCCAPIIKEIPKAKISVDPYNKFEYRGSHKETAPKLFQGIDVDRLVEEFHKHPAIGVALKSYREAGEHIEGNHFLSDVLNYETELLSVGPLNQPSWFDEFQKAPAERRVHNLLMFGLLCFRDSLRNFNQLIFQALYLERLTILNDGNMVDLSPTYSNRSGRGVGVVFQTTDLDFLEEILLMDINEIVLVDGAYGTKDKTLGRVESMKKPLMKAQEPCIVKMRLLDENLNAYPSLLKL